MLLLLACTPPDEAAPPDETAAPRTCPAAVAPPPADLDGDGHADLAWAQTEDAEGTYDATSIVTFGPDFTRRQEFPTLGADGVAVADLDGDGWPELVYASVSDGEARAVDSFVYRGAPGGPTVADPVRLPGIGASAVTIDDVDGDGALDLFLSNRYDGEGFSEAAYTVDSALYLGAAGGVSPDRVAHVETLGAGDARFADLDQDGWTDLVVASGTLFADASRIYYGGPDGYSRDATVELPTAAPEGVVVADWNGDGWLDLFFSNFYDALELDIDSPLYWGSPDGYSADAVQWIATHGATDALAADLDGDDCLELVVANSMTGSFAELEFEVASEVWAGSPDGPTTVRARLPTISAAAVSAADLDGDGDTDLVFANRYDADGAPTSASYVYWNDGGFSEDDRTEIPTVGAAGVTATAR
ncbi:MAG: VCBS repeat-containing protein [Pseudomonadota bacterium]|nr:VCBS repeat-containing protein [Pseudomonadota bacterium]